MKVWMSQVVVIEWYYILESRLLSNITPVNVDSIAMCDRDKSSGSIFIVSTK